MNVRYKDWYLRILFCLISAHAATMANLSEGFVQVFFSEYYWPFLAGNFFVAIALTDYIRFITGRLDQKFDRQKAMLQRFSWQAILGVALPAIFSFAAVAVFFRLYGLDVLKTGFLIEDYAFILSILLAVNIYYLRMNSLIRLRSEPKIQELPIIETGSASDIRQSAFPTSSEDLKIPKEVIVAETPTKSIPIRTENIAYCFLLGRYAFIRTTDMPSLNDSHQISWSLKMLEQTLDKRQFFRINRRMIVNFSACRYYRPGKNKTLELILEPEPYLQHSRMPAEHERLCIVSEDRATSFKQWMDR